MYTVHKAKTNLSKRIREALRGEEVIIARRNEAVVKLVPELIKDFPGRIQREVVVELPISVEDAVRAGTLRGKHKDPFDRVLIAQSRVEDVAIVTRDEWFGNYAVQCIW